MNDFKSPITKFMGQVPANEQEMDLMRRKAWREDGVLSIKLSDRRLTPTEKNRLKEIGERLFGYQREDR
ncbi:MAG: hypothetical protein L6Q57_03260 [Alphaproteobacteria bacterium]|nr:hypothetical protein [Alphaproteobacteria bacterium]